MADTPTTRLAIPQVADADFIKDGPGVLRAAHALIDTLMAVVITTTPRPAAGTFGRFHRAADGTITFDTGSSWVEIAQHAHASKHQAAGSDPLTIFTNMLSPDVPIINVGDIIATARLSLPASGRFAFCNGGLVDRTTYAELFANIGHAYNGGVDPGSNLVRLPDGRGRVLVGEDQGQSRTPGVSRGVAGGAATHALTTAQLATHSHTFSDNSPYNSNAYPTAAGGQPTYYGTNTILNDTLPAGSGSAHNNLQPYQGVQFMVRII